MVSQTGNHDSGSVLAANDAPELVSKGQLGRDLCEIPVFADLPRETIDWLVAHMEQSVYSTGEIIAREGDPADRMIVVLEGELRGTSEKAKKDNDRTFQVRAGTVTGLLPFSRLTVMPITSRATAPTRLGWIHRDHFPEMIATLPTLVARLVGVMADRIREFTVEQQQRDKLISLGRLSAGLAHELNNPAAAAQRSTEALAEAVKTMRDVNVRLQSREITVEQRAYLAKLEADWQQGGTGTDELGSVERCDLEDNISAWLDARGVPNPWLLAPTLVESSCGQALLEELEQHFQGPLLGDALAKLSASLTVTRLVKEIQNATLRISDLVRAVKEYSYMDQAPEQEINIHDSLESTLAMLKHRLRDGVEVRRQYDQSLPLLVAHGSELNQAWTNLIDNALNAMGGHGVLTIQTGREYGQLKVEICDTGAGIPEQLQGRIFDPFFTTKKVGEGTGLGLDIVYRVVKKHGGDVKFESKPGGTRFQVYLPFRPTMAPDV